MFALNFVYIAFASLPLHSLTHHYRTLYFQYSSEDGIYGIYSWAHRHGSLLGFRKGVGFGQKGMPAIFSFDLLFDFFNSAAVVLFKWPWQQLILAAPIDLGSGAICLQRDCKGWDKPIEERQALTLTVAIAKIPTEHAGGWMWGGPERWKKFVMTWFSC